MRVAMKNPADWIIALGEVEEWQKCRESMKFFRYGVLGDAILRSHPLFEYFEEMKEEVIEARYRYLTEFLGWKG